MLQIFIRSAAELTSSAALLDAELPQAYAKAKNLPVPQPAYQYQLTPRSQLGRRIIAEQLCSHNKSILLSCLASCKSLPGPYLFARHAIPQQEGIVRLDRVGGCFVGRNTPKTASERSNSAGKERHNAVLCFVGNSERGTLPLGESF